jgi:pimeloyl-ACP methyl ester carboxylesterase
MEVIDVAGLRVAYECVGNGPPLVLLHGYAGDGVTTWRQQIEGLSDEFTVVAWDAGVLPQEVPTQGCSRS